MFQFTCCENFSITNPFKCFDYKRTRDKQHRRNILEELDRMCDYKLAKETIINVVMQDIKRLLGCEHYILHQVNKKVQPQHISLEEYELFLRCKHEDQDTINTELGRLKEFTTANEKRGQCTNYISETFVKLCSPEFNYLYTNGFNSCRENLSQVDNLFGHVVQSKTFYIANDVLTDTLSACRFPRGHAPIRSIILIPLLNENRQVYAIMGFANASRKLSKKDYNLLKPILHRIQSVFMDLIL